LVDDAERIICPSRDTEDRISKYFGNGNSVIVPHLSLGKRKASNVYPPGIVESDNIKVLILGASAKHKGAEVVYDAALFAESTNLPIEFHYYGEDSYFYSQKPLSKIVLHGKYCRDEITDVVSSSSPHLAWIPSTVPETFSYTLSEIFKLSLPVLVSDVGCLPDRVKGRPKSWVLDQTKGCEEICESILRIKREFAGANSEVIPWVEVADASFYDTDYLVFSIKLNEYITDIRSNDKTSIVFVSNKDACGYIRARIPAKNAASGSDLIVRYANGLDVLHLVSDIIVLQRTCITEIAKFQLLREHCDKYSIVLLFELDDDLFDIPKSHIEHEYYSKMIGYLNCAASKSDGVIVSTPELKKKIELYNPNAYLIEVFLDLRLWASAWGYKTFHKLNDTDVVNIVYIGGNSHKEDLLYLLPVLRKLKMEFGEKIKLTIIGLHVKQLDDLVEHIQVPRYVATNYMQFVRWLVANNEWHIGIAPLVDSEFNRCKSAIKYYDYSALGLASVCSDEAAYNDVVSNGVDGLLATDQDDWYEKIRSLIVNPELTKSLSEKAKINLEEGHGRLKNAYSNFWKQKIVKKKMVDRLKEGHDFQLGIYWQDYQSSQPKMYGLIDEEVIFDKGLKAQLLTRYKHYVLKLHYRLMHIYIFNRMFARLSPELKSKLKKLMRI